MREIRTSGLTSGDGKRGVAAWPKPPRPSSTLQHWLWRAVDQDGVVLDVLVQKRRDKQAAKRLLCKLLKKQGRVSRVMITDKLASYGAAKGEVMPSVEHRRHKGFVWGHRCQGSSLAAAFLRLGSVGRRLRANPRGARHRARVIAPRACIRWAAWGPNHDAAMRISGEAPGRRVQSKQRLNSGSEAIPLFGAPPPRIVDGSSPRGRR
jgi:IS1 family transposase